MSKNPYRSNSNEAALWSMGYTIGLADGEKQLAKAIRRLVRRDRYYSVEPSPIIESILDWLTARSKRKRGDAK